MAFANGQACILGRLFKAIVGRSDAQLVVFGQCLIVLVFQLLLQILVVFLETRAQLQPKPRLNAEDSALIHHVGTRSAIALQVFFGPVQVGHDEAIHGVEGCALVVCSLLLRGVFGSNRHCQAVDFIYFGLFI